MNELYETLISSALETKLFWSLIVVVFVVYLSKLTKNLIYKSINDNKRYYPIKRRITYFSTLLIIICTLFIWMDSVSNLTTYIGLLSAGIAIALKEIFVNIAGWMFIEFRKPFDVGHRVSIGDQKGDVIDKRMFQFTLMEVSPYEDGEQSTGRIIDVPNAYIFEHPTINYTKGFEYVWNEIKVLVTFESDWKKAKQLLTEIINQDTYSTIEKARGQIDHASKKYMLYYNNLTPIVYTDVKESGVQLTIRYLCSTKHRRTTANLVWEDILEMIDAHKDIALAYPTKRVVGHQDDKLNF